MSPIKPAKRSLYPENWPEIRAKVLEAAGGCCQMCQKPNRMHVRVYPNGDWYLEGGTPLGRVFLRMDHVLDPDLSPEKLNPWQPEFPENIIRAHGGPGRAVFVVLTVAHLDHNPLNNDPSNLRALCQRCHNTLDAPERRANRKVTNHRKRIWKDLLTERERQDVLHGAFNTTNTPTDWMAIFLEEAGEAVRHALTLRYKRGADLSEGDVQRAVRGFREELIHALAVGVAIIERIDGGETWE